MALLVYECQNDHQIESSHFAINSTGSSNKILIKYNKNEVSLFINIDNEAKKLVLM